jgi:hypothetical protein
MDDLINTLLVLDSDEGIRIENDKDKKKIFINRNLLGTYSILLRTIKETDSTNKEKIKDKNANYKEYTEEIFNYNDINLVLKFIKEKIDKFDIWIY